MQDTRKTSRTSTVISLFLIIAVMIGTPLGAIWIVNLLPFISIPYTFWTWITAYVGILLLEKLMEWVLGRNFLDELNNIEENNNDK